MVKRKSSLDEELIVLLGGSGGEMKLSSLAEKAKLSYEDFNKKYGNTIDELLELDSLELDVLDSPNPMISLTLSGNAMYRVILDLKTMKPKVNRYRDYDE
jgi:hypothetical protein